MAGQSCTCSSLAEALYCGYASLERYCKGGSIDRMVIASSMNYAQPAEILCVSAPQDQEFLDTLEQHLSALQRQGRLVLRHQGQIKPGEHSAQTTRTWEARAALILLLLSPAFLASENCEQEMRRALRRQRAGETHVIPLIVRPCLWEQTDLVAFACLPANRQPLTQWSDQDEAWRQVVEGILQVLDEQHQSRTPQPSDKIWTIPFTRNPFFTGRDALLERLHTQLHAAQSVALNQPQAINGLGGIGKTQLAVEYAYRYAQEYRTVLWAQAESTETLNASYTRFATLLDLPQKNAQEQEIIVQAFKHWLETRQNWLLVLDNADDLSIVRAFLPARCEGHLLLTTRAQILGRLARSVEVDTLEREVGALLLLRRAGLIASDESPDVVSSAERNAALALADELGGLPLALDQAGAYIEETRCGLAAYHRRYQARGAKLLAHRGMLVDDHPDPVATTWALSFAQVEQANPVAADLLRFCAFLAPEAIPEDVLLEALKMPLPVLDDAETEQEESVESSLSSPPSRAEDEQEPLSMAEREEQIDEVVALLRVYSLIQRDAVERTVSVHRLVQAVLRDMIPDDERHMWAQRCVHVVDEALPKIEFENWSRCERYVSHVQVCVQWVAERSGAQEAGVLYWLGLYLLERHRTQEAGPYVQQALALREQHLGREHSATAASLDGVARWWELQGKYEEAEPLYGRALGINEQALGAGHPSTALSLNNLALLYYNQGKYAEAEPLYERALGIREQALGAGHPDTALSLNNLAALYDSQGKYEEAEPLLRRAMQIREHALGLEHPDTAQSIWWLAVLAVQQQHFAEAKQLYERALSIYERTLGPTHPTTQDIQRGYASFMESLKSASKPPETDG